MPSPAATHTVTSDATMCVVAIHGEVDLTNAADVLGWLTAAAGCGPIIMRVDLAELGFIDCAGIGALVGAARHVRGQGGSFRVLRPRPFIRQVLEITGTARGLGLSRQTRHRLHQARAVNG